MSFKHFYFINVILDSGRHFLSSSIPEGSPDQNRALISFEISFLSLLMMLTHINNGPIPDDSSLLSGLAPMTTVSLQVIFYQLLSMF
jgi:hypothetical protein